MTSTVMLGRLIVQIVIFFFNMKTSFKRPGSFVVVLNLLLFSFPPLRCLCDNLNGGCFYPT